MKTVQSRLKDILGQNRPGLIVFAVLSISTFLITLSFNQVGTSAFASNSFPQGYAKPEISFVGELSQSKLVKGDSGIVYLSLNIETPELPTSERSSTPTDLVVVLDRSGSMNAPQKLPFAKQAIRDLIDRVGPNDRIAVVSFDDQVRVEIPLQSVGAQSRAPLHQAINSIRTGGSTNMSAGLYQARAILQGSQRNKRIILLSDGEANKGISSPDGLSQIVSSIARTETVVSTIGMGLGFNERVMSLLADHGMGNYSYLENLEALASVLTKDLEDSRVMYASSSSIGLVLGDGVRLVDASGYPKTNKGQVFDIRTGQLLAGSSKAINLTFQVPTSRIGERMLSEVSLNYRHDGRAHQKQLSEEPFQIAVVDHDKRSVATSSINRKVYQQMNYANAVGLMQKDVQSALRRRDKGAAMKVIEDFQAKLQVTEQESGIDLDDVAFKNKLKKIKSEVSDAFKGPQAEVMTKTNRLGKAYWSESNALQRKSAK